MRYLAAILFSIIVYNTYSQGFVITPSYSNAVCQNDTVNFVVSTNPAGSYTYQWNITDLFGASENGIGSTVFFPIASKITTFPNFISIKIDLFSGATKIKDTTFSALVKVSPLVQLGADKVVCPSSLATLVNLTSPGTSTYTNTWIYQGNTLSGSSIDVASAGTYTLIVTDNTLPYCKTTRQISVTNFNKPTVAISGSSVRCFGQDLQLFSNIVAESAPPYTYLWKPFTNINSTTAQNPIVTPNSAITYKVIASDANGCKDSASVNVTLNPQITLSIAQNDTSLCKFNTLTISSSIAGGTPGYSYKWAPVTGVSDSTNANATISPISFAGIVYTLTGTDANSCTATDLIQIKKHSLQFSIKDFDTQLSTCIGNNVTFKSNTSGGFAPYNYTWNPLTELNKQNDSLYISKPITTPYMVKATVTDGNGCSDADSVNILVNPKPTPNFGTAKEKFACVGSSITSNIAYPGTDQLPADLKYTWKTSADLADVNASTQTFKAKNTETSTFYPLTVTNIATKCVAIDSIKITSKLSPVMNINAPAEPIYRSTETDMREYTFNATASPPDNVTYRWVLSDSTLTGTTSGIAIRFGLAKTYILTVAGTNEYGCTGTQAQDVRVRLPSSKKILIPTVFSPNSADDRNRKWYIFGQIDDFAKTDFSVKIFNILGQLVYQTTDIETVLYGDGKTATGWDGTANNVGVYTYIVSGKWADEETFSNKGSVTLIK
ncbi:MAG: gliding motility-associated C-terminal domain-containing protein [Cytophagales bacterium]|nr:gliding motility-associated C-terminal domain-containing protein [Cytophagales bacterium]